MSFKLLIECSKDIDELHINFSDGTTTTVEKPKETASKKEFKEIKKPKITKEQYSSDNTDDTDDTDWGSYLGEKNVEKISPPSIPDIDIDREINVAGEMKNAEF